MSTEPVHHRNDSSSIVTRPWTREIIYMILVDRFHRGASTPGTPVPPFWGGNVRGILEKLDYLQDLGVTALWLSPLYANQPDGYHGYWPVDFYAMDPRFGTFEDLGALVKECHARGLKVLLDKVLNHAGYLHPMAKDPKYKKWFHTEWNVRWMDKQRLEMGSLHGLPDFAQERPEVRDYLIKMCLWWQEKTGVDGFRLDAVKHVPIHFWKLFSRAMHDRGGKDFLLLGEVFRGIPSYLAQYQAKAGIEALFDVPFGDTVRTALVQDSEAPGPGILKRLMELRQDYKTMLYNEILRKLFAFRPTDMRTFESLIAEDGVYHNSEYLCPIIDNHDLSRFITEAGGSKARLKMALTLLLTWRGIPVLTYGTEQAMAGTTDGGNRAPMAFDADPDMFQFTRRLLQLRRRSPALQEGPIHPVLADRQCFVFLRPSDKGNVLVALNNSVFPQDRELALPGTHPEMKIWHDAFDSQPVSLQNGRLKVRLEPRSAKVWLDS